MPEPIIVQIPIGPFQVMTYLVGCPNTGEAAVIDPAGDPEGIRDALEERGWTAKLILNTHGHPDHVLANRPLKDLLGCPTAMHEADDAFFSERGIREGVLRELGMPGPDPVDRRLKDKEVLRVGDLLIEVIHTPGHTPGSCCFRVGGHLVTGDTLFVGAIGRTDLSGGSLDTLLSSIETRLLGLPPETAIWPGHDYGETPVSTVGRECEENPYITDFILDR